MCNQLSLNRTVLQSLAETVEHAARFFFAWLQQKPDDAVYRHDSSRCPTLLGQGYRLALVGNKDWSVLVITCVFDF